MRTRAFPFAFALTVSATCLAPVLVTNTAQAQSADAMTEMARQRFQEGVQYYDAKDYEKARAAFLQAYALKKHPAVLLNLAQSELRSSHEADAAAHFELYLRENPGVSAAERSEAQKGFDAAKAKVAEFPITAPSGAQVFVDGEPVGTAPLPAPVYLSPGNHKLEARKGSDSAVLDVTGTAGSSSPQTLSFGGASGAVGPGPVAGGSGAMPPPEGGGNGTQPPPDDGGGFSVSTAGEREPFMDWAKRGPVSYVGGGLFAAGLISGIIFAISSRSSYNSADDIRDKILVEANKPGANQTSSPCVSGTDTYDYYSSACAKWQDNVDAGDTKKTVATISFIAAGVGAAIVGGGYFFTAKKGSGDSAKKKSAPRTYASPILTPDFKGLSWGGSF